MDFRLRKATLDDADRIASIVEHSVRGLACGIYSEQQIELSLRSVFGVDDQLINDSTYFVAESGNEIGGCGGWSRRKTLYGASDYADSRDPDMLDPTTDPAKIRAFFIHPDWARKGIGTAILNACEEEARMHGFASAEMMSTLPGVPLYTARGYTGDERVDIPVGEGITIVCIRMSKKL
jgi:GNAT superfamily N-acetyltransferase